MVVCGNETVIIDAMQIKDRRAPETSMPPAFSTATRTDEASKSAATWARWLQRWLFSRSGRARGKACAARLSGRACRSDGNAAVFLLVKCRTTASSGGQFFRSNAIGRPFRFGWEPRVQLLCYGHVLARRRATNKFSKAIREL